MLLTTWGVKSLKQFHTIILKSMNQNHMSKTRKHKEHSILSINSHVHQTQQYYIYNHKGKIII